MRRRMRCRPGRPGGRRSRCSCSSLLLSRGWGWCPGSTRPGRSGRCGGRIRWSWAGRRRGARGRRWSARCPGRPRSSTESDSRARGPRRRGRLRGRRPRCVFLSMRKPWARASPSAAGADCTVRGESPRRMRRMQRAPTSTAATAAVRRISWSPSSRRARCWAAVMPQISTAATCSCWSTKRAFGAARCAAWRSRVVTVGWSVPSRCGEFSGVGCSCMVRGSFDVKRQVGSMVGVLAVRGHDVIDTGRDA